MWSGGNELFNIWYRMTDQSLVLRLINSLCFHMDPQRPFIMTSPIMGVGHGHYRFREPATGEEVFQLMKRSRFTSYVEFGMPGPSPEAMIRNCIPEDQLWPPKPGTAWEADTWLVPDTIEHYFGPKNTLEELIANGQLLQSEGYKCIYESARRQKPNCSMALNWCFIEPWPTAANNSLLGWPAEIKPAYRAVQASCRPILARAGIDKFIWYAGEEFTVEIGILNDFYGSHKDSTVVVKVIGDEEYIVREWEFPALKPNTNIKGPTVRFVLPPWEVDRFKVLLEVTDRPEWNSEYILLYRRQGC
jgi:beta-mannosidase